MSYPPKEVTCKCGNPLTLDRRRVWCPKCGQPTYYHEKEQRWHKINSLYVYVIFVAVILMIAYFFIEMIAKPFLN